MAGFARADITPPLGVPVVGYFEERFAKKILDPLEASALAVSDGENTAVLIAADLLGIEGTAFSSALRSRIASAAGIADNAVFLHCTHTHTGPGAGVADEGRCHLFDGTSEYNELLAESLSNVAKMAVADMVPASLAYGRVEAKRISFVRRYRMKNGTIRTNPGVNNPDIDSPLGTPDETVQVVRIRREGKGDIAVLNFATHPDVVGGEVISGDWPAFARRTFERAEPGVSCIFFNGAQGDVNHVCTDSRPGEREGLAPDFDDVDRGYEHAQHMGRTVAAAALSVWGKCVPLPSGRVRFDVKNVSVPSQRPSPEELPQARRFVALHGEGRDEEIPFSGMELTTVVAEAGRMLSLENGPDFFEMPVSAVSIGDSLAFTGVPGEPFTEIGRGVKTASPFAVTLFSCLTNGSCGYFPMKSAYSEGGYEARSSIFGSSVADDIIAGQLKLLNSLKRSPFEYQ